MRISEETRNEIKSAIEKALADYLVREVCGISFSDMSGTRDAIEVVLTIKPAEGRNDGCQY